MIVKRTPRGRDGLVSLHELSIDHPFLHAQVGMEIEVRPGIVSRDAQGRFDCRCAHGLIRAAAVLPYTSWCMTNSKQ